MPAICKEDPVMETNIRLGVLAAVIAVSVAAVQPVQAGNPAPKVPDGPKIDFVKADRSGDGNISMEEAQMVPDLTSAFEMLDSDRNELISRTEFARWSRAGNSDPPPPPVRDPATLPSGSAGSQHMPKQ
jgi:hypothetical protein